MLDRHSCQICYPIEINILLLLYYLNSEQKGADQTARMRRLSPPLLFAYGIRRFFLIMTWLKWN